MIKLLIYNFVKKNYLLSYNFICKFSKSIFVKFSNLFFVLFNFFKYSLRIQVLKLFDNCIYKFLI